MAIKLSKRIQMPKKNKEKQSENHEEEAVNQAELIENQEVNTADTPVENATGGIDELALEKEKYMRLYSEFDNYKRRTAKERLELIGTAHKDLIQTLLPVLDDMERALASMQNLSEDAKKGMEGIDLIYKKLHSTLTAKGLKAMDCKGLDFDVEFHEAITKVPIPNMKGKVVEEVEKGYMLHEAVLRYAKVVVGE